MRRQHFIAHELDPLLCDLSPTSTLEALQSTDSVLEGVPRKSALIDSVAAASTSERAWGIKAALAGKKVRDWCRELAAWPWPTASEDSRNGFESLPDDKRAGRIRTAGTEGEDGASFLLEASSGYEGSSSGSLLAQIIQQYEERIEDIWDDMETLELEELKEHVRATHLPSSSRRSIYGQPDSSYANGYAHLDDFTAVTTATIMQTLPDVSRLNALINVWSVRLLVLRQVPGFLDCMEKTQAALDSAWDTVEQPRFELPSSEPVLNREAFATMRSVLEEQILELGQRLDSMLDALEGREDTVPNSWIDRMEAVEADFGTWVVKVENQILKHELHAAKASTKDPASATYRQDMESLSPRMKAAGKFGVTETSVNGSDNEVLPGAKGTRDSEETEQVHPQSTEPTGPTAEEAVPSSELESEVQPPDGSDLGPTTPSRTQSDESHEISSYLKKLLSSRKASAEDPGSPFAFSPSPSPLQRPKIDLPSSGAFKPLMSRGQKTFSGGDGKVARSRSNSKPKSLNLNKTQSNFEGNVSSDFSSDNSYPGSATSDDFSNMSSPEIQHASRAEYFGAPVKVTTPSFTQRDPVSPTEMISRQSSQRTERGRPLSEDSSSQGFTSPACPRSQASSFLPETAVPEDRNFAKPWLADRKDGTSHIRTRSASTQSFEFVPRNGVSIYGFVRQTWLISGNQIRSVVIRRSFSYSATPSASPQAGEESPNRSSTLILTDSQQPAFEKPEVNGIASSTGNVQPNSQGMLTSNPKHLPSAAIRPFSADEESPNIHQETPSPSKKARNRFEDVADSAPGSTPVQIRKRRKSDSTSPFKPNSQHSSPSKQGADQLEARISSILDEIPAHIRLTSGAEADPAEVLHPGFGILDLKASTARQTPPRFTRAQTSTLSPSMTLAPGQPKTYRGRPGSDPEVKLYHLHQVGKDAPIKLFVRLVGEAGERVMVRIGGGWADLGEYLKEYANHHGKRSVSDSRYAIQELPSTPITSSPAGGSGGFGAPNSRPISSSGLDASTVPMTPEHVGYRLFEAAPGSIPSNASLRPGSRRHSVSEDDSPLGGAGPKTKKADISPSKQAWVDGMLDQARKAGAEKSKGHAEVGDLGKVGGTKRVFLRSKTTG